MINYHIEVLFPLKIRTYNFIFKNVLEIEGRKCS